MTTKTLRVLCVDDHAFLVDGLKTRLELEPDMLFVGRLESAETLTTQARDLGADVVLLDIEMPGPDPFEALEDLMRVRPGIRVIMLSAHVRDHYIDSAVEAGAWGYFSKSDEPNEIIDGIRKARDGEFAFGPKVLERSQSHRRRNNATGAAPASRLQLLTAREKQVLRMIGKGLTRSAIASEMHRSPKTVDTHRLAIMNKLDIHDRGELVRFAIREGLAEL